MDNGAEWPRRTGSSGNVDPPTLREQGTAKLPGPRAPLRCNDFPRPRTPAAGVAEVCTWGFGIAGGGGVWDGPIVGSWCSDVRSWPAMGPLSRCLLHADSMAFVGATCNSKRNIRGGCAMLDQADLRTGASGPPDSGRSNSRSYTRAPGACSTRRPTMPTSRTPAAPVRSCRALRTWSSIAARAWSRKASVMSRSSSCWRAASDRSLPSTACKAANTSDGMLKVLPLRIRVTVDFETGGHSGPRCVDAERARSVAVQPFCSSSVLMVCRDYPNP